MPTVGDARINITAVDKTKAAFRSANRSLDTLKVGFRAFGVAVAGVFAGKFIQASRDAAKYLGDISDVADKLGLTTSALQELRYAAEQAGVGAQKFDIGFQRFTRRLADAQQGNKALVKTFDDFGISLRDNQGRMKTAEAVFGEFADAIKSTDDQGKRVLKTFQLFDTEGVDLVRLLQQGSGAIKQFRDEARSMGAVVDDSLIRKADAADKRLAALNRVIKLNLSVAMAELAPLIIKVAEAFAAAAHYVGQFFDRFRKTENITSLQEIQRRMQKIMADIKATPKSPPSRTQLAELEDLSRRWNELNDQLNNPVKLFGGVDLPGELDRTSAKLTKVKDAAVEARDEMDMALDMISAQFEARDEAIARQIAGLESVKEATAEVAEEVQEQNAIVADLGFTFSSAFEEAILGGNKLRDVLQGLLKDILAIFVRTQITEPLAGFISGAIPKVFGAAAGTNYAPGGLTLVGERGPELVNLPRGSQVIPNHEISAGVTINVDARGSNDPAAIESAVRRAVTASVAQIRSMKTRGALPEFA